MPKSLFITFFFIINILGIYAFVSPKTCDRRIVHIATSKEPLFEGLSSTTEKMPAVAQKKMKSNNIRWVVHGIITELYYNIFVRTLNHARIRLFTTSKDERLEVFQNQKYRQRQPRKHEIALVTGATGGIGSQIAHDLAFRGYDVVIAARNEDMGKALAKKIEGELKVTPTKSSLLSENYEDLPAITFVEYHADVAKSAVDVASSITDMKSPLTVLINNAGIMGKSKQQTMRVNLLGPTYLTFALLPLMAKSTKPSTVINVGSSAHLRATCVVEEESLSLSGENSSGDGNKQSWIGNLPDIADDDLSTYAQSKLALMQFSTLLRNCLHQSDPPIQVIDAHPGLVWTPLLRNHIGEKAVGTLTKTGLANLLYKSSSEGARGIVSALDYSTPSTASSKEQVYYVNGKPGGYSACESISIDASNLLWKCVLEPEVDGVVDLPKGWACLTK